MDEVRVMIATIEHTRVCSTPYKIGAITHVYSDHLAGLIVRRARVSAHASVRSNRMRRLSDVALRGFFSRHAVENSAAITVESSAAKRCVGHEVATQSATLTSSRVAHRDARIYAGRTSMMMSARFAGSDRPCIFRGASRYAQQRTRENAIARVFRADGFRHTRRVDAPRTSFASHNHRATGVVTYLRLIGHMPVSAVPCDRNAGGVTQWDTASRREPSPGAT
jgi:hypothetical protein